MEQLLNFMASDWKKDLVCSQCENLGWYRENGKPYFCSCRVGQEHLAKVEDEFYDND